MTTERPEGEGSGGFTWWERLSESTQDTGASKGLLRLVVVAAVVVLVGILGWQFFDRSKASELDDLSGRLNEAARLLPGFRDAQMGQLGQALDPYNGDPARYAELGVMSERGAWLPAASWFENESQSAARSRRSGRLLDAETAAAYVDEVETMIGTLDGKKADYEGSEQAWLYWHILQQLHHFAAINHADAAKAKTHLDAQTSILDRIDKDHADHPLFRSRPNTDEPDKTLVGLWREAAERQKEALARPTNNVAVKADENLEAVLTLDNGATLRLRFFSRVAPKAVAAFVANARAGHYDGTAVNRIDKDTDSITFGNPMTKVAPDRKFLWDKTTDLYNVPVERTPVLRVEKGAVTLRAVGLAANAYEFEVHLEDDLSNTFAPVFAEVVEGLESLREWLATEVHDEAGLENPGLPRTRLGLASVKVDGEIQHPSPDSWTPKPALPELPEVSDREREFQEALAGAGSDDKDESGDDD